MPPQQPNPNYGPTMPASPSPGQFDFIMNSGQQPGQPRPSTASTSKRALVFIGGMLLLIFIAWVFLSILSNNGSLKTAPLISLEQKQNELARICQSNTVQLAGSQSTQNFAQTATFTLQTDQQTFITYMKKYRAKAPATTTLSATQSSATDTDLSNAQSTGTFNATFISITQAQLTAYEQQLVQTYNSTKRPTERQLLQTAYRHAQLLLSMSKQTIGQ